MKALILLLAFMSYTTIAQETKPMEDDFLIMTNKCHAIVVNMLSGEIFTDKGTPIIIRCQKKKKSSYVVKCTFREDATGELIIEKEMNAVIIGKEAIVMSEDKGDMAIINLMSRKVINKTNVYLRDGAIRGEKICNGDFIYDKEVKEFEKSEATKKKK